MRPLPIFLAVTLALATLGAFADPAFPPEVDTTFQGTFASGISLTGTIGINNTASDPSLYSVDYLDATAVLPSYGSEHFALGGYSETTTFFGPGYPEQLLFVATYADGSDMTEGDLIALYIPLSSFLSAQGGPLCSITTPCIPATNVSRFDPYFGSPFPGSETLLESGSLCGNFPCTTAVTPEPAPFVLLATGLAALAGSRLRRSAGKHA